MDLRNLERRIDILVERTGKDLPRVEFYFYSQRQAGDVDNATHLFYSTPEERDAIRARLHALPDGPDVHRIIIHGVTAEEIAAGEVAL
jgi:hypothetical protein